MKNRIFIIIVCIISISIANSQKSDNYGYYNDTKTVKTTVVQETPTSTLNAQKINRDQLIDITPTASTNSTKPNNPQPTAAPRSPENEANIATPRMVADHAIFDEILRRYVDDKGNVDYAGIQKNSADLERYIKQISNNVPSNADAKNSTLAYWINAYNAHTIKMIVDNYPVKSIMDINGGKAFDKKWIILGKETLSLNDIENKKIRAVFNEPRIHFAVNCAAKSCPPILNRAWMAADLESTLEVRARSFINDPKYNTLQKDQVMISKIFEWYAKDFPLDITTYLNKYSKMEIAPKAKVSYIEYDWALNKQ